MDETRIASEVDALVLGMIGMFGLTLIIVLFVVVYQRKLLRQERRHKLVEEEHRMELLRATIQSQEVERDRISRELHDGVGVMLSTSRMYLEHWNSEDDDGKVRAAKKVDELLSQTIESVRRVSADLRPVVLETLGLAEAITDLADTIINAGKLEIDLDLSYAYPIQQKDELNIYRVVQELLTNTLRHAQASAVVLEVDVTPERFLLIYRDNGKGLPSGKTRKGLGLKNMENRINALNGQFTIESPPEGGILVNIEIEKI